jgi:hypothetical protein
MAKQKQQKELCNYGQVKRSIKNSADNELYETFVVPDDIEADIPFLQQ